MISKMEPINFNQIRPYDGEQHKGFEELVCQLARREAIANAKEFRRVEGAGGDGGVEAYWLLTDGSKHGYQAKYHLATKYIDWAKIDGSVKMAIVQHPEITRYTIAIPCDFTDRSGVKGKGKTGWEHWEGHKLQWENFACSKGMTVEFHPWTKSDLSDLLMANTANRGLVLYWFNALLFDLHWFRKVLDRTVADLDERYNPDDHVELDLKKAFNGLARTSEYRNFLSDWFCGGTDVHELVTKLDNAVDANGNFLDKGLIRHLAECCNKLNNIGMSLRSGFEINRYPIQQWQDAILNVSNAISPILDWLYEANKTERRDSIQEALKCIRKLDSHLDRTPVHLGQNNPHNNRIEADIHRNIIIVGEAGIGKSHLFADVASSFLDLGTPNILLLGQHFPGLNIKSEFLHLLDLNHHDFETVLQALNTAGESARTRLVIMIDALNETDRLKGWRDQLAGFVFDILQHDWLAIAASVRPEYEEKLISSTVSNNALKINCYGIQSPEEQEQAAIQYIEKRGITRPATPWLAPEFSNFLFLRTSCNALKAQGMKEFPKGLHGSQRVLKYYLDSIQLKVKRQIPGVHIPDCAVIHAIKAIAEEMANQQVNYIFEAVAISHCQQAFFSHGPNPQNNWFAVLASEGVFRKDHIFSATEDPFESDPQTIYRFTYQRFADHLIVKALLRNITAIDDAFLPNGPLYFLNKADDDSVGYSLFDALAVQIPEKFPGKEFIDLVPENAAHHFLNNLLIETFEQSLLWRDHKAFSERTREVFNQLPTEWSDPRIGILARLALVRNHPWNAENFLHSALKKLPMPKRDALWSVSVNSAARDEQHPLWGVINWCLKSNLALVDTETARLAATTLAWTFTSSHRPLRDKATKGLISLFAKRPEIIPGIVERFGVVDDLYVLERICAAVFGSVSHGFERQALQEAVFSIYTSVFASGTPPLNLNLRDYARATIEYASAYDGVDERIDIRQCRPPYKSEWPLRDISEEELEALAEQAGGTEILRSSYNWGGDFGTYETPYRVHHFTNVSLGLARPLNEEERKTEFDNQIESWDIDKQIAWLELKFSLDERRHSWRMDDELEDGKGISFSYSRGTVEVVEQKEQKFIALLSDAEREIYTSMILPVIMPERFSHKVPSIPEFDSQFAKRWVTKRAYEFGWNKELFPKDHSYSDDHYTRNRPTIERIGKKYQWLALSELMARFSDNVWTLDKWPEQAMQYDHPATDWFVRDVEPSILIDINDQQTTNHWWQKLALELEPVEPSQLRNWPFSENPPNVPDWLDVISPDGTPWLLLYGLFSNREKRTDNDTAALSLERQIFVRVSTILVKSTEVDSVMKKMKGCRLSDPSGHECLRWTDGPFLCEYPWRNTWNYRDSVFEEGSFGRISSRIRYIRPVAEHTWESHLDLSLKEGFSTHLLHPWIAQQMGLVHDFDYPGSLVSRIDNQTVFIDPSIGCYGSSGGLINKTMFFEFLKTKGLDCIWIIAGERNSYPSGNHGDYSCRYFASTYRWTKEKWAGNKWHNDEGSDRTDKGEPLQNSKKHLNPGIP